MAPIELPLLQIDAVALITTTARPVLINRDPCPAEEDVPLDAAIALELVDPGLDGIDRAQTRIAIDGVLAFDGSKTPPIAPRFAGPRSGVTDTGDTLRIVLDPTAAWPSLATVTVRVVSLTRGATAALDETYAFIVEDRTAPRLLAAQAIAAKAVRVSFDESVSPGSGTFVITARGAPAMPVSVVRAEVAERVVLLLLDTEMSPDVEYEVRAQGVADRNGNTVVLPFDRVTFTGFRPPRPPGRHFDLWSMLPAHNRRDDHTGDLRRFIACLQDTLDLLLADIDRSADIFDLERAPEKFLDLILSDLGNPFAFELDALAKRRLASMLVALYQQKGTARGIRNAIRFFLGIDVGRITAFSDDTLTLGESELGTGWVLGPSSRFARYAFNIEVGRILSPIERRELRAIVDYLRPAHTHFVGLIEPLPTIEPDHWELGLSELGASSDLH